MAKIRQEVRRLPGKWAGPSLALVPRSVHTNQLNQGETASIEIKNLKLFAWQDGSTRNKYVEVREFRETQDLQLIPSVKFDVVCEIVGVRGSRRVISSFGRQLISWLLPCV